MSPRFFQFMAAGNLGVALAALVRNVQDLAADSAAWCVLWILLAAIVSRQGRSS